MNHTFFMFFFHIAKNKSSEILLVDRFSWFQTFMLVEIFASQTVDQFYDQFWDIL